MIEHAYERLFSYMTEDMGYKQVFVPLESLVNVLQIQPVPIVFPQFHQIPENDKFWGKGFTEWTKLNECERNYLGTEMMTPHADIGQYRILDDTYLTWCENAFKKYMINTVCYYHYWFNGHKVMHRPIEHLRDHNKPDVNFVLAWANETWSSRWDGQESQTLIKQDYDEDTWVNFKLFGVTSMMFIFMMAQTFMLKDYLIEQPEAETTEKKKE
jgi:lipopolysaccharide biosynthesis protein